MYVCKIVQLSDKKTDSWVIKKGDTTNLTGYGKPMWGNSLSINSNQSNVI